jgi:hypothetical protein
MSSRGKDIREVWGYTAFMWLLMNGVTGLLSGGDFRLLLPLTVLCLLVGLSGTLLIWRYEKPLDSDNDNR